MVQRFAYEVVGKGIVNRAERIGKLRTVTCRNSYPSVGMRTKASGVTALTFARRPLVWRFSLSLALRAAS